MPNWVKTRVRIEGPQNRIASVERMVERARMTASCPSTGFFEQIAPRPFGIDGIRHDTRVGALDRTESEHELRESFTSETLSILRSFKADGDIERMLDTMGNLVEACRFKSRCGHASWYGWSLENWGVKWDVCGEGIRIEYVSPAGNCVTLSWETAWNLAHEALEALWRHLGGECTICGEYADEDIGSNCGTFVVEGGRLIRYEVDDPFSFAMEMWGIDPEECKEADE